MSIDQDYLDTLGSIVSQISTSIKTLLEAAWLDGYRTGYEEGCSFTRDTIEEWEEKPRRW